MKKSNLIVSWKSKTAFLMQMLIWLFPFLRKPLFFSLLLLGFNNTFAKANNQDAFQGAYFAMGADYTNSFSDNTSNITIPPPAGIPSSPTILRHDNKKGADGFGIDVGAGYRWRIFPCWSWSLGGQIIYRDLTQKGDAQFLGLGLDSYAYQYNITATTITTVGRLIYTQGSWQYFGELKVGLTRLFSDSYQVSLNAQSESYASQTVVQPMYGIAFGVMRHIALQTSIGFSVGYSDLGTAKLGARQGSGIESTGQIEQKLHLLNTRITITQWF